VYKKRTKIVCTIGPASSEVKDILAMLKSGMNVARINFSHGTHEDNAKLIRGVRGAAKALDQAVAVILDLQGPRVRASGIKKGGIELLEGEVVVITTGPIAAGAKTEKAKNKVF